MSLKKRPGGKRKRKAGRRRDRLGAARRAQRSARGDARRTFLAHRDATLAELGGYPGVARYQVDATAAWRRFSDQADATWQQITGDGLGGKAAVSRVSERLAAHTRRLDRRMERLARRLRRDWGLDAARDAYRAIRSRARDSYVTARDAALDGLTGDRRAEVRRDAVAMWNRFKGAAAEARDGIKRWIAASAPAAATAVHEVNLRLRGPEDALVADLARLDRIDLDVGFLSQRVANPYFRASDVACADAAKAMARNHNGVGVLGPAAGFQLGYGEDATGDITTFDRARAEEAVLYLDSELEAGRAVVVGVTYHARYNVGNADGITDHFVTVGGRGPGGSYTYLDPWPTTRNEGTLSVRDDGKLVSDDAPLGDGHYEVTIVRRNG